MSEHFWQLTIAQALRTVLEEQLGSSWSVDIGRYKGDVGAVVIEPVGMKQPDSSGINRTRQQEYLFRVHVGPSNVGDDPFDGYEAAEQVFNAASSDPYLRETCWQSQVLSVRYRPHVSMMLTAKRAEVF